MFWQSVHAGAVKASRESGVEIEWNGPVSETDFNGQLQIVEAMINKRVDAIALAPIDKKAMVNVVERATRQGERQDEKRGAQHYCSAMRFFSQFWKPRSR